MDPDSRRVIRRIVIGDKVPALEFLECIVETQNALSLAYHAIRLSQGFILDSDPPSGRSELFYTWKRLRDLLGYYNVLLVSLSLRREADPLHSVDITAAEVDACDVATSHLNEIETMFPNIWKDGSISKPAAQVN